MRKSFFYSLAAFFFVAALYPAYAHEKECDNCIAWKTARFRQPRPTLKPLTCANFTLPEKPGRNGTSVLLKAFVGNTLVIKRAKKVSTREGRFCYPTAYWQREGKPTRVFFCSEHSVTLRVERGEIDPTLSGRGKKPNAYACLRGVAGCGGVDNVSIPEDQLDR